MIGEPSYGTHSAEVQMRLIVEGKSLRITHMGPDFVLVESPTDQAPGEASIMLRVNDSESQWKVKVPEGISKGSKRVALALCE
jgi:hypothetical protein